MQYRRLGRTELSVSEISLGTVELGMEYGFANEGELRCPSFQQAEALLHRALDLGINFIDTARAYGESEAIIGQALSARRRDFILASKVQTFTGAGAQRLARMQASIEESLRTLRTDCLDILLLHSVTLEELNTGEVTKALLDAKRKGKTKFIGASVYGESAARAAILTGQFDYIQLAWSLLDRRPESEIVTLANEKGIGLIIRSILMRGALTHRRTHLPEALSTVARAAERLEQIAAQAGMSLPELAYRYILSQSGPITALVGTAHLDELEKGVRFSDGILLTESVLQAIHGVSLEDPSLADLSRWPA